VTAVALPVLRRDVSRRPAAEASVLDLGLRAAWLRFLRSCADLGTVDCQIVAASAREAVARIRHRAPSALLPGPSRQLEAVWYASIAAGTPDYGVYVTDAYLGDLWACWACGSRGYLRELAAPRGLPPAGFRHHLGPARVIVDLGCGTGLTTAALYELFPASVVVGTNLPGTVQWALAAQAAAQYGFRLAATLETCPAPADLVFASEYFEHWEAPLDHLADVLATLRPRALLTANTFQSPGIGHFPRYRVAGVAASGRATAIAFAAHLRAAGYTRVPTRFWNQRPTYWRRSLAPEES
jgi:SAM-dependent methyltransferase